MDPATSAVIITAMAEGTATITVTATDRPGVILPVSIQTFNVEVTAKPNDPPSVRTIGRVSLDIDDQPTDTVDLSEYFTDPDGDTLTYTARSHNDQIATVDRTGSVITITAVGEGSTKITVTAKDEMNDAVSQTFSVDVGRENNQPRLVAPIPDATGLKKAYAGDPAATHSFNVSQYFTDDDDDELDITASSSNRTVVTVATAKDMTTGVTTLTITVVDPGTATITVLADDGSTRDSSVRTSFRVEVLNEAPMANDRHSAFSLSMASDSNSAMIDLSEHFTDREEDPLTYSVASIEPAMGVVTATVSDSTLTVMATGAGDGDHYGPCIGQQEQRWCSQRGRVEGLDRSGHRGAEHGAHGGRGRNPGPDSGLGCRRGGHDGERHRYD